MSPLATILLVLIRTYDAFGLPARELEAARIVAGDTLRSAGLEAAWTACDARNDPGEFSPNRCLALPRSGEVIVRIVGGPDGPNGGAVLGYAFVDPKAKRGVLATLFVARIGKLADEAGIERSTLLGRAIAHEVGHLLLGTSAHRPTGLMRAHWTLEELRRAVAKDWLFSRTDAAKLQQRAEQGPLARDKYLSAWASDRLAPPGQ